MKKVILLSSGQPSANPRLVKEAIALFAAGYGVTVIYCPLSSWADTYDENLFKQYPGINWVSAGQHNIKNPLRYKWARLRRKFYAALYKRWPDNVHLAVKSFALFIQELYKEGRKHKADIYIGHNLAALPVVVQLSKANRALVGFDAEDFHRGEDLKDSAHWNLCKHIENLFFPQLNYFSAASPLILDKYKQLYNIPEAFYIPNVPEVKIIRQPKIHNNDLHLFWFSQSLGTKRGIETVLQAIGLLNNKHVKLFLLGNAGEKEKLHFRQLAKNSGLHNSQLSFHSAVSPEQLITYASQFDIGLATEISWCENRNLCETNKLFTYLAAGLALVYSNTAGQVAFAEKYSGIGLYFKQNDAAHLANIIDSYFIDRQLLHSHQKNALQLADTKLNWRVQQLGFLKEIEKILS